MIYFAAARRQQLLREVHRLLCEDGYLLVGHAESLTGVVSPFRNVGPATYVRG
jgi:chemotaxis methyl-accepting protein methylase